MTRKAIAAALLDLLAPPGGVFPTRGRRLPDPETVSSATPDFAFPALFLIKPAENYSYDGEGDTVPPTREMQFLAVILTDYSDDPNAVPADNIDDLLDGIDAAMAPSVSDQITNGNRQTLGGLVYNAIIFGEPHKIAPGDWLGKGETLVPIRVTLNQYP